MAVRTVTVILQANVAGAIANLRTFQGALTQFGTGVTQLATQHQSQFNQMTAVGMRMGAGLLIGFGLAERAAMAFDKQMSAVAAVSQASAGQMEGLRQAALNAGRDTAFTAVQAAKAEEELAKAGVSTADILGGGLKGALNLAAAGSIDLAKAATIASIAMVQFGLSGKDVGHIADVLTAGANKSATDVQGLGYALGQTGSIAHQLGISLDETVGVLASFAQHGMLGEEAGTALKTMLVKLEAPSAKAKLLMEQYGISLYDASGKTVNLTTLAGELQKGLGGLSEEQRNAALATIFGTRAIKAATVLYQEGATGVSDWTDKVNDQGIAADTAAKRLDNLAGDLKKLQGSMQALAIDSSGGATKGLRALTQAADFAVHAFLDIPTPITSTITVLAGVTGAALLASTAFLRMRASAAAAMAALTASGPVGAQAAGLLGTVGKWAGRAAGAGAVALLAYEGIKALGDWVSAKGQPVARNIDLMAESLGRFAESGRVSGELSKTFGPNMEKLARDIDAVAASNARAQAVANAPTTGGGGGGAGRGAGGAAVQGRQIALGSDARQERSDIAALDQALANLAAKSAPQAALAFDKVKSSLMAQGKSAAEVNALFGKYSEAAAAASASTGPLAQGFADTGAQAHILGAGLQDSVDKGQKLTDVFNEMNGAMISLTGAQISVEQGLADLTAAFQKNGNSVDISTQAGRDNMSIVLRLTEAAVKAAEAKYNESGSVEAASATYQGYIVRLHDTLRQAGFTEKQTQDLIDTYGKMPRFVDTTLRAYGLDEAGWKISSVTDKLNALSGRVTTTTVVTNQVTNQIQKIVRTPNFQRWGGVYPAAGGLLNAGLYDAGVRPLYMFAEPETGGEAFIPRQGSMTRSRGIADYVVTRWLGGTTSWGPDGGGGSRGGAGSATINLNLVLRNEEGMVLASLRRAVNNRGGNVQAVVTGRSG